MSGFKITTHSGGSLPPFKVVFGRDFLYCWYARDFTNWYPRRVLRRIWSRMFGHENYKREMRGKSLFPDYV